MRYTFDNNPAAEQVIASHQSMVAATVKEVVPPHHLAAIVMIGGYGRSEGAWILDEAGHPCPYNDYDYFVVFRNLTRRQAWRYIRRLPDLEAETGIDVDFFPLLEDDIPHLEFSLMNAEMAAGHAVIWGDVNVLASMPDMPLDQVPMVEFQRLLTNRGCLLLMNRLNRQREDFSKFINKAWLAIGDTALAQLGEYTLSYIEKRERAAQLLTNRTLITCYQRAIDIRMRPDLHTPWGASDLAPVIKALLESLALVQREDLSGQRTFRQTVTNMLRHVLDRRLPVFDLEIFNHPRSRVTAGLRRLLGARQSAFFTADSEQLLDLWGRYS